jgi:histidine triad (HIT) family protein
MPPIGVPANACVFCGRIERGEFDYCTDAAVSFEPLNPVTPGHLLVVPRMHVSDATVQPWVTAEVMRYAAELAGLLRGPSNIITSVGKAATQSVFHLHVHLVPRREGDGLHLPWTGQARR